MICIWITIPCDNGDATYHNHMSDTRHIPKHIHFGALIPALPNTLCKIIIACLQMGFDQMHYKI